MIHEYKQCKYCNEEFHNIEGRTFSNHVQWCEKNPSSRRHNKMKCPHCDQLLDLATHKAHVKSCLHNPDNHIFCKECEKQIVDYVHDFCSASCAATYNNRARPATVVTGPPKGYEWKLVVRSCCRCGIDVETTINNHIVRCDSCGSTRKRFRICPQCNLEFFGSRQYCSNECVSISRRRDVGTLKEYRRRCNFEFALKDFPKEFDFSLIEEHGWYKAKNRGDNLYGVSRDHMVSVRYGFDNDIDPSIISHPSNCELLPHSENVSKRSRCSITLEELQERIEVWDEKYSH